MCVNKVMEHVPHAIKLAAKTSEVEQDFVQFLHLMETSAVHALRLGDKESAVGLRTILSNIFIENEELCLEMYASGISEEGTSAGILADQTFHAMRRLDQSAAVLLGKPITVLDWAHGLKD